jgi:hypothetical protein
MGENLQQIDVLVDGDGEFYYKSNKFEIKKEGKDPWNYAIYMDGKRIRDVVGVDISLIAGQHPIISLEIVDLD